MTYKGKMTTLQMECEHLSVPYSSLKASAKVVSVRSLKAVG